MASIAPYLKEILSIPVYPGWEGTMKTKITRRAFLGGMCAFVAHGVFASKLTAKQHKSLFLPCRQRRPNPYMENGKPIVMVVRGTEFKPMLAKGMSLLGGFSRFGVKSGIHLKPNFVATSPYPETTDGLSLLATIELLQKEGLHDITIAEHAGSGAQATAFQFYGLDKKANVGGFKIKDLYNDDDVLSIKDSRWIAMPHVSAFKCVYETPLIINMPTLKQHGAMHFTCALKNTMGQVDYQTRMDMHRQGAAFANERYDRKILMSHYAIAEIASAINPDLTIIDARYCMGKSHHIALGGRSRKADRLIISGDPLAADRVAAEILAECYSGFITEMAKPHLDHAARLGLGAVDLNNIVIKDVTV